MSPEQLQGKPADSRSDIFSFGAVLYEMLSGKRAFEGSSAASVIAAVLERQPAPLELSPPLDRVIRACLEKDPEQRMQTARDAKRALEWAEEPDIGGGKKTAPSGSRLSSAGWIAAAIALLGAVIAVWTLWPRPAPSANIMRFEVPLPSGTAYTRYISVSPDGRKLAFNATRLGDVGIWVRDLESTEWRHLPGTDHAGAGFFWSPDNRFLAFADGNELKKIDVTGGPAQTLCQLPYSAGTGAWNQEGTLLFSGTDTGPLWRVSQAGGMPTEVTSLDTPHGEVVHGIPGLLPDGKHFLYIKLGSPDVGGTYVGSLDLKPAEQPKQRLIAAQLAVSYANGYVFFMSGNNTLMAQPFDAGKFRLQGEPVPVAEHVFAELPLGAFSASPSGVLAYWGQPAAVNAQLTWIDPQGKPTGTVGEPGPYYGIALSPDETRLAYRDSEPEQAGDIWTLDLARGVRNKLTSSHTLGSNPVWSPDGTRVAFAVGFGTLHVKDASGAGEEKEVYNQLGQPVVPTSWSSDKRFLLYYTTNTPKTGTDLWLLRLEDHKAVRLLATESNELFGAFSPDMRWIAYMSNESGRNEIYVRPFVAAGPSGDPVLGDKKWAVSRDGVAGGPHWRSDSKQISFGGAIGQGKLPMMLAADVNESGPVGAPRQVGKLGSVVISGTVSADGKRYLVSVPVNQSNGLTPFTVVLNWPALLKK